MDKFSSVVGSNKKHIELFLTVLILLNFAPYEVLPGQMGNQVKSLMGPFLTPVQSLMSNVFVRALLAIPLTPASLPVLIKNIITAIPISKPPTKAGKGVKLMVSIVII